MKRETHTSLGNKILTYYENINKNRIHQSLVKNNQTKWRIKNFLIELRQFQYDYQYDDADTDNVLLYQIINRFPVYGFIIDEYNLQIRNYLKSLFWRFNMKQLCHLICKFEMNPKN